MSGRSVLTHLGQRVNPRLRDSFPHNERGAIDGNDRSSNQQHLDRYLNDSSDRSYERNNPSSNDSNSQLSRDDDFFPSR